MRIGDCRGYIYNPNNRGSELRMILRYKNCVSEPWKAGGRHAFPQP